MSTPMDSLNTSTDAGEHVDVMLQVTDAPEQQEAGTQTPEVGGDVAVQPSTQPIDPAKPADVAQPADQPQIDAQPLVDVAPALEVVDDSKPHDILASIFDNYDTPEAAVGAANESLDRLFDPKTETGYDRNAYYTLANTFYFRHRDWYQERALKDAGIPQEKVGQFSEWLKNGGDLPAPYQAETFPEPDQNGIAVFQGIQYDTNDDVGKALYANAKELFDLREGKRQSEASAAQQAQKEKDNAAADAETKLQQERDTRVSSFVGERNTYISSVVKEATKDYGSPLLQGIAYSLVNQLMVGQVPEMLANVPELTLALGKVKQLNALSGRAGTYIANGDGRTAEIAEAADAITKDLIAAALSPLNKMILRTRQAERVALSGRPNIPGAPTVTAGTQVGTNDGKPKTEAEIERNMIAGIGAKFGG